ncbi:MAG: hypothetical protein M1549_00385 [Candidatus Dependentiae bacterium]|jgi:hypothetical protein|nr:hypothetical protein [Candidatus Dependentiae bacterium]
MKKLYLLYFVCMLLFAHGTWGSKRPAITKLASALESLISEEEGGGGLPRGKPHRPRREPGDISLTDLPDDEEEIPEPPKPGKRPKPVKTGRCSDLKKSEKIFVTAINKLENIDVQIRAPGAQTEAIALLSKKNIPLDPICRGAKKQVAKTYTVLVGKTELAQITIQISPKPESSIKMSIRATGKAATKTEPVKSPKLEWATPEGKISAEIKLPAELREMHRIDQLQLRAELGRKKEKTTLQISISKGTVCTEHALIEATNKRTDLPAVEILMDGKSEKKIPVPAGTKYVPLDHVCLGESPAATRTASLLIGGREVATIECAFFKDKAGTEQRIATIRIPASDKQQALELKSKHDEQIESVITTAAGTRVRLVVLPVKEGIFSKQSKFKIYLEWLTSCKSQAWVEVMNERSDLRLEIVDSSGNKQEVLDTTRQPNRYKTLEPICQPAQGTASEIYTVLLDGKETAKIRCTFGMVGANEVRKAEIMDLADTPLISTMQGPIWYNFASARISVDSVKEVTGLSLTKQSKFKIYVQQDTCEQNAIVEVQNQRKDIEVAMVRCDAQGNELDEAMTIPYHGTSSYLTFDRICRQASKPEIPATHYYKISLNKTPGIIARCTFHATNKLEVTPITIPASTLPLEVVVDKNDRKEWRLGDLVRITIECFKQSGQNKFKFYIERTTCFQDALVEAANQQSAQMLVRNLETNVSHIVPNWNQKSWLPLPRICRPAKGRAERHYLIIVDGAQLATIKCTLLADGTMATQIRSADNSCCLRDNNQGKVSKLKYRFDNYTVEIEAVNEGIPRQSKFKMRLQDKSWASEGPVCGAGRCAWAK